MAKLQKSGSRAMAVKIAQREGHRSQVRIGDINEVLGIVADLMYEDATHLEILTRLGINRAKRKKKNVLSK